MGYGVEDAAYKPNAQTKNLIFSGQESVRIYEVAQETIDPFKQIFAGVT